MNLAINFCRIGPYHHARLVALGSRTCLVAVECSSIDKTYAWDTVSRKDEYQVVLLFKGEDVDALPMKVVTKRVNSVLAEIGADAVSIPGWSSPAALAVLAWCRRTRTPSILMSDSTAHDEPRKPWKEWVKSRVVRQFSSALVAGSPHVEYAASLSMPRERIFTGYDVVDNTYFQTNSDVARQNAAVLRKAHGLPDRYFLASNRFIEKKNLPRLLDAYAAYLRQAGEHAWSLVLVGDGPLMPAIRSQVERLGLEGRVHFPGFKQYDELPVYYGLASAFVQASTSEQWGLVVNEAMASGLPVLVSERCGCAPDLVRQGVNGFTFDPYDIDGLAGLMLRISDGQCDLAAMGRESRSIVSGFTPQVFAENMLKAAEAALAAPGPRFGWFDKVLLWTLMRR